MAKSIKYTNGEKADAVHELLIKALQGTYTHPADRKPKLPAKRVKELFEKDVLKTVRALRKEFGIKISKEAKKVQRAYNVVY
jgi:hypothetical protein